jgi:N-acetylglucosamine-6-sulfatase
MHRTRFVLVVLAVLALVGACTSTSPDRQEAVPSKPNIVFVLTDDLAMNLLPYLPHVQAMAKSGTSFANYTVTDSLCCPSRASTFTGKFPHDTGIFTNGGDDGGFGEFDRRDEAASTFATTLQKSGYRTAMMGKYLNGYEPTKNGVPAGWNEWDVAGGGYKEYDYDLNVNSHVEHHAHAPADYLTDVLAGKASAFIESSGDAPFMLEVATFAPHSPSTPAPQDENAFAGLKAPRGPAFDKLPDGAPKWLASREPLSDKQQKSIDMAFRKRAQSVQAVDRMIGTLQDTLQKSGVADSTELVFASDNGFHMGEYRLMPGKMTAFDTDVNVPLVVTGPGVRAGQTVTAPAENIDLRPTFEQLGHAVTPSDVDGASLVPLLTGAVPDGWRTAALVEHHGPDNDKSDPDHPGKNSGNPATYEAIRTTSYTYVEYADGTKEYYDRVKDPQELHNTAASLPAQTASQLHALVQAMAACHGRAACTH